MATIFTTKGDIDETLLVRKELIEKTPQGASHSEEYYLDGELVKRSVHFVFNQDAQMTPV